jgi:cell division control protein 6
VAVPESGWPVDRLVRKAAETLDAQVGDGVCFLVLDEIDVLVAGNRGAASTALYNLTRLHTLLKRARVVLIGISNVLDFKNRLDARVRSSLAAEELIFPPYNANQLCDILAQRAALAFERGALEEGVVPLCAAYAAREDGDARKAITLLHRVGDLAERRGLARVTEELVGDAYMDGERDRFQEYICLLPLQSQAVILATYLLHKYRTNEEIISGSVYRCYGEICEVTPLLPKLTSRSVSDIITELELASILSTRIVNRGRGGRTKEISFGIPLDQVEAGLSDCPELAALLNRHALAALRHQMSLDQFSML